jgi:predicted Zn-dependent protease
VLPGYVAISSTVLSGVYLAPPWRLFYSPFSGKEPVAVIGNSIRVYWIERWPETPTGSSPIQSGVSFDGATHGVLAQLLLGLNWFDQAAFHYRRYLSFYPSDVGGLGNLGIALMQNGETEEALRMFRQAAQLGPDQMIAQQNLTRALLERGQLEEAGVHAQKAVNLGPNDPAARFLFGRVLAAQGHGGGAIAQFGAALELDPSHGEARQRLCYVLEAVDGTTFVDVTTFTDVLSKKYCRDRISRIDALP